MLLNLALHCCCCSEIRGKLLLHEQYSIHPFVVVNTLSNIDRAWLTNWTLVGDGKENCYTLRRPLELDPLCHCDRLRLIVESC